MKVGDCLRSSLTVSKGFDTLHRLPNACELYRIPRECSRDLNLLVYGLIYWIATPLTWLAMTKEIQCQAIQHPCHCEPSAKQSSKKNPHTNKFKFLETSRGVRYTGFALGNRCRLQNLIVLSVMTLNYLQL